MEGILSLLKSRKFWLAMVGVIQTVIFNFIPDFPEAVWQTINALLLALIATYALEDAAAKRGGTFIIDEGEDKEPEG
jgi:hypothetical protein